jgi:hypothetical protein
MADLGLRGEKKTERASGRKENERGYEVTKEGRQTLVGYTSFLYETQTEWDASDN